MKFLEIGLKYKNEKEMTELIMELKENEEEKIMIQGIREASDRNELKVEYNKAQKKFDEEINVYNKATQVSTFRATALPLLDEVLYHIVSWIIPLMAAFAYDDDNLSNLKLLPIKDKGFCWTLKDLIHGTPRSIGIAILPQFFCPTYYAPISLLINIIIYPSASASASLSLHLFSWSMFLVLFMLLIFKIKHKYSDIDYSFKMANQFLFSESVCLYTICIISREELLLTYCIMFTYF
ncbi:17729_t:CDS:2 [Dentiscutata erythropus]|uniref:17729_t:CDS:1 n=1 Tax=Dentiscutata erythropus TaxID=1348616 RepID=A0A9N8ZW67_9GLOM|nr:17729_t:CDS:2 [Dentiscutata erythropus]